MKVCFLLCISVSVNSADAGERVFHSCAPGNDSVSSPSRSAAHTELLKADRRLTLSAVFGTGARPGGAAVLPHQQKTSVALFLPPVIFLRTVQISIGLAVLRAQRAEATSRAEQKKRLLPSDTQTRVRSDELVNNVQISHLRLQILDRY